MRQIGSSCGEAFLGVTTEESVRPPRTLSSGGLASAGWVGPGSAGCARAAITHEINKREIKRRLAIGPCTLRVLAIQAFLRMVLAFAGAESNTARRGRGPPRHRHKARSGSR